MAGANDTIAANVATHRDRTLLAPGQIVFVPIGNGAASVTVSNDLAAASRYIVADGIVSLLGGTKLDKVGASKLKSADAAAAFVSELTNVFQNYRNCTAHASTLGRVKCGARLAFDVGFAGGRLGIKLGPRVVGLVVSFFKQVKFDARLNSEINAIAGGQRTLSVTPFVPVPPPANFAGAWTGDFKVTLASNACASTVVGYARLELAQQGSNASGTLYYNATGGFANPQATPNCARFATSGSLGISSATVTGSTLTGAGFTLVQSSPTALTGKFVGNVQGIDIQADLSLTLR